MKKVFLDDERQPRYVGWDINDPDLVLIRSGAAFFNFIDNVEGNLSDFVFSFDHDLGDFNFDKEITGYDCLRYLIDVCFDKGLTIPTCTFHTANIVGKNNMISYYYNSIDEEDRRAKEKVEDQA